MGLVDFSRARFFRTGRENVAVLMSFCIYPLYFCLWPKALSRKVASRLKQRSSSSQDARFSVVFRLALAGLSFREQSAWRNYAF